MPGRSIWSARQPAPLFGLSNELQHYRIGGPNLFAAIVIYCNTAHLGEAIRQRRHAGLPVEPELLAHISPLVLQPQIV